MTERFTILMYHMISAPQCREEAKYACPPELFEQHLGYLRDSQYNPVSLSEIENHLLNGTPLPANAVAVTLDDGFEDNFANAFPLLEKFRIPATIFLASGLIGKTNEWMSQRGFPERKMLDWTQIQIMNGQLISFGAHTVSHPKLSELNDTQAMEEIGHSKKTIEEKLGLPCSHFAYPYGLLNDQTADLVGTAGFKLACSTRSGFNNQDRDPFLLHRIEVYGNDPLWKLKQKLTFGINDASRLFPIRYYGKRLANRLGF